MGIHQDNDSTTDQHQKEKRRDSLSKKIYGSFKDTALTYLMGIESKLHRIVLSGDKKKRKIHNYRSVEIALEGNLWFDPDYRPEDRRPTHGAMLIRHLDNFQINVFTDPLEGYYPPIMIEIHPQRDLTLEEHKKFLVRLNRSVPGLKVKQVEYANDLYCPTPTDVKNLFWIVWRCILIPRQKTSKFYPDDFVRWGKNTNSSMLIGKGDSTSRAYERGKDEDKEGDGWNADDLDRVRLEHTSDREELVGHGIDVLEDLIEAPKFFEINKDIWNFKRFKNFKRSKKGLPQEWEAYPEEDDTGYPGSFYPQYKKHGKPRAYVEAVPEFAELQERLMGAMTKFDIEW